MISTILYNVHREFCEPDVTEHVETGHSHLNNRMNLSIAKELFKLCNFVSVKCHDHAYLLCLMTVKVISLLNLCANIPGFCMLDHNCDRICQNQSSTHIKIFDFQQLYIYDAVHLELSLNYSIYTFIKQLVKIWRWLHVST